MKILVVNNTMNIGGIESFLMNVYRNIDRTKYEFTFLTYNDFTYDYEEEIIALGGKILRITNPNKTTIRNHLKELKSAIQSCSPDVIHCHTYFNSGYVLLAARLSGVRVRITHSHTAFASTKINFKKSLKWMIARVLIKLNATDKLACSTEAGLALYKNNDFKIITNGIDLKKFYFKEEMRKKYRQELKLREEDIIVGHIGRFDTPKNHKFLVEIMSELVKIDKRYKLILVGSGNLQQEIEDLVKKENLSDNVIFLGNRSDVFHLLNAFDVFVFPSIFEGLPVTLVEVQANGLRSLISSNISKEIKLSECIEFYSLEKGSKKWAQKILNMEKQRIDTKKTLEKSSYSIEKTIEDLEKIYNK